MQISPEFSKYPHDAGRAPVILCTGQLTEKYFLKIISYQLVVLSYFDLMYNFEQIELILLCL